MNKWQWFTIVSLVLVGLLVLSGCQRESAEEAGGDAAINIDLRTEPDPPMMGEATLYVTLEDAGGEPIHDASVSIRGDMDHAGMVPVIRDVEGGEAGVYTVPFEWTMGGDWIVTVEVMLADGTEVSETFDLAVMVDEDSPMDDMDMGENDDSN